MERRFFLRFCPAHHAVCQTHAFPRNKQSELFIKLAPPLQRLWFWAAFWFGLGSHKISIPYLVKNGTNGLLGEEFNKDEMAKYILELSLDEDQRLRMGEAGYHLAIQKFSRDIEIDVIKSHLVL